MSPFAAISRRRVLKWSAACAGVVLAGGGALAAVRGRAPHVAGLRALDDHAYRTLLALTRVHLPRGGAFELGAEDLDVDLVRTFDDFLAHSSADERDDLKTAIVLLELGPVLFEQKLVTFPNLPPAEQARHFAEWGESSLLVRRQVAFAFRKFLSLVFYDHPKVWPHIGYGGPLARPVSE